MALIGLDARMAGRVPTGLGTYATHLARAITALDRRNSYVVIRAPDTSGPIAAGPNVEEVALPGDLDTPRNLLRGRDVSRLGLDLYHSLHHFLPPRLRVPKVVLTLQDLIWIEHAALIKGGPLGMVHSGATHLFARAAMRYAIGRADRIVAPSGHTCARAVAYYGLAAERISVVHHGVDAHEFPFASAPLASPPYFLVVGNTRPYKNIATAVRAFAVCARRHPGLELHVVGRGDSARALGRLARSLGVGGRVRFEPAVGHAALLERLHGAAGLVFPSLVEGFGLPVLEAMSAGCPVVASRAPAVAEVAGDAALLCDAADDGAFAAAMIQLLEDEHLRNDFRMRGRQRAARFTWERCAAGTLAVYREMLC